MSAGKAPSLHDVARSAGVSAMTVSRVMHNSPRVLETTRQAVQKALRKLGYRPDPHVVRLMERIRSHRQRKTHAVIGVIRDDMLEADPLCPFVPPLVADREH